MLKVYKDGNLVCECFEYYQTDIGYETEFGGFQYNNRYLFEVSDEQ